MQSTSIPMMIHHISFSKSIWLLLMVTVHLGNLNGVQSVENAWKEGPSSSFPNSSMTTFSKSNHKSLRPALPAPTFSRRLKRHPNAIEVCNAQFEEANANIQGLEEKIAKLRGQLKLKQKDIHRLYSLDKENKKLLTEFSNQFQLISNHPQSQFEDRTCAVMYNSQENIIMERKYFTLTDESQTSNIQEDSGWITTGLIRIGVANGCNLTVCSKVYLNGECGALSNGLHSSEASTSLSLGDLASARCSCKKECKCSDIPMKKSSCARAYIREGCNECNSQYVELRDKDNWIDEKFARSVRAFRIRKGCTLTLYPDEGEEIIFEEEVVENYQGNFHSYECKCDDSKFALREKPSRPSTYPPLIDIPEKLDDLLRMLNEGQFSTHPGLQAAQKSLTKGRSSKNAYILVLGSSGSGKTSTIGALLGKSYSTDIDCTPSIREFKVSVPIDELGVKNSELRLITPPGTGTFALHQDAINLANLDSYLSNHEELKDKIPNVVLVVHKFHDSRYEGKGSAFIKMLRSLNSLRDRITDENYSNVIFVLTHFLSETKSKQRRPEVKIARFKKVIEVYSLFPKPITITVAENKGRHQDLPMVNGHFKLPNNEYFPRNLIEKMERATKNGRDMIGLGVLRSALAARDSDDDLNVEIERHELVKNSPKADYYMNLLTNITFSN